ncbi:hypothetical protein BDZ89DRAFT_1252610 [Hymenopellis radicata]|nr:hypothetical protein BDZ89DRAFT_1252610 [Hymenopellis radicata]
MEARLTVTSCHVDSYASAVGRQCGTLRVQSPVGSNDEKGLWGRVTVLYRFSEGIQHTRKSVFMPPPRDSTIKEQIAKGLPSFTFIDARVLTQSMGIPLGSVFTGPPDSGSGKTRMFVASLGRMKVRMEACALVLDLVAGAGLICVRVPGPCTEGGED